MVSVEERIQGYRAAQGAVRQYPEDPTALFNLAWWSAKLGKFIDAVSLYERSIGLGVSAPEEAMTNIASIYSERLGAVEKAQHWLQQALSRNSRYFPAVFNNAHLAEQCGDRQGAVSGFERALALEPNNDYVLARLCEALDHVEEGNAWLAKLRATAGSADPDVLLSLARLEEQLGNFDLAWQAMQGANQKDAQRQPLWPSDKVRVANLRALDAIPSIRRSSDDLMQKGPVFIVGMFRTGSTLFEQILSAHSAFTPLGESEFWPRHVASLGGAMVLPGRPPDATLMEKLRTEFWRHAQERGVDQVRRLTDKRPDNLFHLPLILPTLPSARVVITQRDWRDTLISVYGTRLHAQHGYATDIANIRSHIKLCHELADQWSNQYPERVRIVNYENLVADPEGELRQLLHWLDEPWESGCLAFHEQRNSVRTASVWQVREPLGAHRIGRWRHYEQPLRAILGDRLERQDP